jgi:hypothetical protein
MDTAYQYARAELLGLQFESFSYGVGGKVYTWDGPTWLATLPSWLARLLFGLLVKVS